MNPLRTARDVDRLWDASDYLRRGYVMVVFLSAGLAVAFPLAGESPWWAVGFGTMAVALLVARAVSRPVLRIVLLGCGVGWALRAAALIGTSHDLARLAPLVVVDLVLSAIHVSQAIEYRPPPGKDGGPRVG